MFSRLGPYAAWNSAFQYSIRDATAVNLAINTVLVVYTFNTLLEMLEGLLYSLAPLEMQNSRRWPDSSTSTAFNTLLEIRLSTSKHGGRLYKTFNTLLEMHVIEWVREMKEKLQAFNTLLEMHQPGGREGVGKNWLSILY